MLPAEASGNDTAPGSAAPEMIAESNFHSMAGPSANATAMSQIS